MQKATSPLSVLLSLSPWVAALANTSKQASSSGPAFPVPSQGPQHRSQAVPGEREGTRFGEGGSGGLCLWKPPVLVFFSSLDAIILPLITLEGGIIIAHCPQQKIALVLENSEGQEPLSCPSW